MRGFRRLAVGALLAVTAVCAAADGPIAVRDAWVREAPPGALVLAAYLTLENPGIAEERLVAVLSPDFERVEMHATRVRDGVASMVALDALPIAPRSVVKLAPGGYHFMLLRPRRALVAGATVHLELRFDSGVRLTVSAPVRRAGGGHLPHPH